MIRKLLNRHVSMVPVPGAEDDEDEEDEDEEEEEGFPSDGGLAAAVTLRAEPSDIDDAP